MHNVYMLAVHSRDDYAHSPRRDRMTNHRRDRLHMTIIVEIILHSSRLDLLVLIIVEIIIIVNYKDSYYLYIL